MDVIKIMLVGVGILLLAVLSGIIYSLNSTSFYAVAMIILTLAGIAAFVIAFLEDR